MKAVLKCAPCQAGICHFFINSEKLKNCDFSDILYYTDCC
ncbi:MAG: DUF1963 domain-containing protein [Oscillospiraceae bacterium]|nr:DUF1963 domain-containing protein [Oscillospiraceae bacterium]